MNGKEGVNKGKDAGKDRVGEPGAMKLWGSRGRINQDGGEGDNDGRNPVNKHSRNTECEPKAKGKELRRRRQMTCRRRAQKSSRRHGWGQQRRSVAGQRSNSRGNHKLQSRRKRQGRRLTLSNWRGRRSHGKEEGKSEEKENGRMQKRWEGMMKL